MFYVYEHWRPDLGICFYVGKGQRQRAYYTGGRNNAYKQVAGALQQQGLSIEVRIIAQGLTEREALQFERWRISFWRGRDVNLANRTDGGEGYSGFIRPLGIKRSDEARRKISAARKGMKFSAEHRAKLAQRKRGVKRKPFTEATRAKMRRAAAAREAAKRAKYGENLTRWSRIND